MESLRTLSEDLGLVAVKTYIQTGNIVFQSPFQETAELELVLKDGILKEFGYDVPVLVNTVEELGELLALNPFIDTTDVTENKIYFVLLHRTPEEGLIQKLNNEVFFNEKFKLVKNCVYLKCNIGYGKAKLDNNSIERKLKVTATTRNYKTMNQLLKMAKQLALI